MSIFHGLSSPDELKRTWFNMTEGQGLNDITVIWDFKPDTLTNLPNGNYILNILYSYIGNKTGHYVALYKNNNQIIYFDPLGSLPPKWITEKLKNFVVDLEGAQAISGNSCGYRCLTKLFKYNLGYMPDYKIYIDNNTYKGKLKPETIFKTKREFKILDSL